MSREDDDKAVGYKKPPQKTRFQKGQSGNPSGRRKSQSSTASTDDDQPFLSKKVKAKIAGKEVWISKREVLRERLFAIAMDGNVPAFALLFRLDMANDNKPGADSGLTEAEEEALIARFLARKRSGAAGGGDG
nr:DUF5681 domain-containing protein [Methylobacterium sp. ZNC0032]